jgi:hypothetical protein
MSNRAWLAIIALALLSGVLIGWSGRVLTLADRYIFTQIELQDTESRYYRVKTDQMIQENKRRMKDGK